MKTDTLALLALLALLAACTAPKDEEPADDSATDDSSADDSASDDTGSPSACAEPVALFEGTDGTVVDLTETLLGGAYTTLDAPGRLSVCPGTWFARLLLRADIEVVGLGASAEETVLSGGEQGTILDVSGPEVTVRVSNLTLDRGAGLDVDHNSGGGGLYCEGFGTVEVDNVRFTHNFANDGSALYVEDCEVLVTNAVFADNVSEDDGGALTVWYSHATVEDSVFEGNTGLDGGAMAVFYGSATLRGVDFVDNLSTHFAGGVWFSDSTAIIESSSFVGNINTGDDGGAILLHGAGTLTDVVFTGNAGVRGGGLFVYYEAEVEGTNCSFDANSPEDIFAADYSEAGGVSHDVGAGYSFTCAANVCAGR